MVSIVTTYITDIEKAFRGHLPQNCINILAMMAEQQQGLEKAINDQQRIIESLRQAIVLSVQADAMLIKQLKKFNHDHDDPHKDFIRNEEIK